MGEGAAVGGAAGVVGVGGGVGEAVGDEEEEEAGVGAGAAAGEGAGDTTEASPQRVLCQGRAFLIHLARLKGVSRLLRQRGRLGL